MGPKNHPKYVTSEWGNQWLGGIPSLRSPIPRFNFETWEASLCSTKVTKRKNMVKVWGSHDMLSTMLLPFLQEAMPHLMMTTIYNYTIQQTAPGIALDVAFVLAGDGRAWLSTSTAHRCRAAVGFHQSSMSESTVAGKKPQKTATWREKNMPKYPKISLKKKNKLVSENGVHRYTFSNDWKRPFFCSGGRFTRAYSGKFLLRITVCHVDLCQVTHRKCVWPGWAVSRCLCYSCCICAWLKTLAAAPFHHRFQGGVALVDQPLRFFQTFGRNSENFLASHWSRYPLVPVSTGPARKPGRCRDPFHYTCGRPGSEHPTDMAEEMDLWTQWHNDVEILRKSEISDFHTLRLSLIPISNNPNTIPILSPYIAY